MRVAFEHGADIYYGAPNDIHVTLLDGICSDENLSFDTVVDDPLWVPGFVEMFSNRPGRFYTRDEITRLYGGDGCITDYRPELVEVVTNQTIFCPEPGRSYRALE